MTDLVEVAITTALNTKLKAFATANSLRVAYPNVPFTAPKTSATALWLRANYLPADTVSLGVVYNSHQQHYGFLQVDVMYSAGGGERPALRMAAALTAYFERGTRLTSDSFIIEVVRRPFRNSTLKDDPWIQIPVRIPYTCFSPI